MNRGGWNSGMPADWVYDESEDISNELTIWRDGIQRITDKRIILDDKAMLFLKDIEDVVSFDKQVMFMSRKNNIVFNNVPSPEGIVALTKKLISKSLHFESVCKCGIANVSGARFCNQCGLTLR